MSEVIWTSTLLWALLRYGRPVYIGKVADWTTSWMWRHLWGSSSASTHELQLLEQQQRTMEMMEYQILFLTREMKRLTKPLAAPGGKELEGESSGVTESMVMLPASSTPPPETATPDETEFVIV